MTYVDSVALAYELENGRIIRRSYNVWMDNEYVTSEAGRIARDYLTRWETVNSRIITVDTVEYNCLDYVLRDVDTIYVDFQKDNRQTNLAEVQSLIAAVQADCAEGHMAQSDYYHTGYFRTEDEYAEKGYYDVPSIGISIGGENYSWWISIFADSRQTIQWLRAHGLLDAEVCSGSIYY